MRLKLPAFLRSRILLIAVVLALLAGWVGLRFWQGPEVDGYLIQSTALVQTVVASGRVESVSRARISSEIAGLVLERRVEEGDRVEPGQVLLRLRDDLLQAQLGQAEAALEQLETCTRGQAQVALELAIAQLAQAERETRRRRELLDRSVLSRENLEQAEQAEFLARNKVAAARLEVASLAPGGPIEKQLRERLAEARSALSRSVIRAQSAGLILTRSVEPGDLVQPGQVLFTLALDGTTELRVPVDEKNLSRLALGQAAIAIADARPDAPFAARVENIAPRIDPQRGTVDLRLLVTSPPEFLRQDMTVSVTIETGRRENTLAVPNDALNPLPGGRAEVLVVRDGRVRQETITLGLRGLARSEVLSGLDEDDRVLANPMRKLGQGARVRFTARPWPDAGSELTTSDDNELPLQLD